MPIEIAVRVPENVLGIDLGPARPKPLLESMVANVQFPQRGYEWKED
jgi:hypothetical protein